MKKPWTMVAIAGLCALAACGKGKDENGEAEAEKKAHESAIADLKQPIALISVYAPFVSYPPESKDKYFPKRHTDLEQSTQTAANEVRYAANKAKQTLEVSSAKATVDLQGALKNVTTSCADAVEPEMLDKCNAALKALDASLEKTQAAATAMGVAGKYPRIGPDAVTPEAKKAIDPFLRSKGPTDADKAYAQKRADAGASVADVITACQAAMNDASSAASTFEKAEESIRLIAVKRKMSMDSQCHILEVVQGLQKDVNDCRKKPKNNTDCKVVCGKAKNVLDEGVPAAAFQSLQTDFNDVCDKR